MRLLFSVTVLLFVCATNASAQHLAAKEAEIKRLVPYQQMVREMPGLTMQAYNEAVRELARKELRTGGTMTIPPAGSPGRTLSGLTSSTSTRIGGFTYYNDSAGASGTSTRIGSSTYYNDSNGVSGSTTRIAPFTYYNMNKEGRSLTGSTTSIGQFDYHNFSNGVTGTSTRVGNTRYDTFSNGRRCTSTTIGTVVYTNCS
jgi:hypothetical protein